MEVVWDKYLPGLPFPCLFLPCGPERSRRRGTILSRRDGGRSEPQILLFTGGGAYGMEEDGMRSL
jgi:hypothetical protein